MTHADVHFNLDVVAAGMDNSIYFQCMLFQGFVIHL